MIFRFNKRQLFLLACDIFLIQVSWFLSFFLRFEGTLPNNFWDLYLRVMIPATLFKIIIFVGSGLYKKVWRYANLQELMSIIQGITMGVTIFVGYVYFTKSFFPRSIIILDWMLNLILIGGFRLLIRLFKESKKIFSFKGDYKNVLIIGAGDAGEMVLKEYLKHNELKKRIVGFIDDDPAKLNLEIHNVKVLGNREKIPHIINRYNVEEVVIAMPSASGKEIREIHQFCAKTGVIVRILPGVYEIINGDVSLNQIREVQVEDLLRRKPVKINSQEISDYLAGKTVFITGGGGSIGSELCRQVAKFKLNELIIFDISENNVYELELELKEKHPGLKITPVIGSIRDITKLKRVFDYYRPDVVFHAAAHKHVPLMEFNPDEAVKNNIFGTRNVALIADEYGVEKFVMISTDKAVNPTNVMGATKRVAEMIIQDINKRSKTKFVAVRFGNVLGSRGSVIPLFKKQIMQGGPVTVTHPEITRYFMTIPEASQLVLQAGALGEGGEVFVLDMGKPIKIVDLARDLIELSGLKVGEDIEIKITGLRPGEKLFEEIFSDKENMQATRHERIMIARLDEFDSNLLHESLGQLEKIVNASHYKYLVPTLVKLVANYKPDKKLLEKEIG